MISKRAPRSSGPQVPLRQFALNNSKGIDLTKAPTDPSTVQNASNLVPNLDGSLSVRKPLYYPDGGFAYEQADADVHYLFDNTHVLVNDRKNKRIFISESKDISNLSSGRFVSFTLKAHGYDGSIISTLREYQSYESLFVNSNFDIVNTSTTTVIGNVKFKLDAKISTRNLFNTSLYPEDYTPARYLKVYRDGGEWYIEIMSPEVNVLNSAEDGSLAFDNNLALDNPYALRDVYTSGMPSVKGILMYSPRSAETVNTVSYTLSDVTSPWQVNDVSTNEEVNDLTKTLSKVLSGGKVVQFIGYCTFTRSQTIENDYVNVKFANNTVNVYMPEGYRNIATRCVRNVRMIERHNGEIIADRSVKTFTAASYASGAVLNILLGKDEYFSIRKLDSSNSVSLVIADTIDFTLYSNNAVYSTSVEQLTEIVKDGYRIVSSVSATDLPKQPVLKAFGNVSSADNFYASWFKSLDGVVWEQCNVYGDTIYVREPVYASDSTEEPSYYTTREYVKHRAVSPNEIIQDRVDTYIIPDSERTLQYTYMFKVISVSQLSESDAAYDKSHKYDQYVIETELGRALYTAAFSNVTEYADWDLGNPVLGRHLYYSKKLFSYGEDAFENTIYATEPGSFITPLSYIADVNVAAANGITTITPWRNYILAATPYSLSILMPQEVGWTSKILSTSIGIPEEDCRCCLPGLNGIIFKSGSKVYMAYPNAYSGDDTHVYVTDLSKPVEHLLEEDSCSGLQFAFATNSEYILMLPDPANDCTRCLRYSYDLKTWTYCEYNVIVKDYVMFSLSDIRLFVEHGDKVLEVRFDSDVSLSTYGDVLEYGIDDSGNKVAVVTPIRFELDTGLKTDNLSTPKQFVETKFIFATEDELENFPMSVIVAVDGDVGITRIDVNSDAPFWKTASSAGVAGTAFRLSNGSEVGRSSSGIIRQLIVRHSGKGKSVRHILEGTVTSPFRLYETYVRYKILNTKK